MGNYVVKGTYYLPSEGPSLHDYRVYFGTRHYEWLCRTASARRCSKARIIKELIDQAMEWDNASQADVSLRTREEATQQPSSLRNARST